jgi:hypothetical protein
VSDQSHGWHELQCRFWSPIDTAKPLTLLTKYVAVREFSASPHLSVISVELPDNSQGIRHRPEPHPLDLTHVFPV